jgi:acetyltransferase-like isoleucine patch superfamily enzyme
LAYDCAIRKGQGLGIYRRLYGLSVEEYAEYIRQQGRLYSMGKDVGITYGATIMDPEYVSIGNNVLLSVCTLIGHDASIAVLNRAYNTKLDSVGKIEIRDNVFIGFGAIVMPNVSIGPNAIVAAGAVVTKDVQSGDIVAGIPARPIGRVEEKVNQREYSATPLGGLDCETRGSL